MTLRNAALLGAVGADPEEHNADSLDELAYDGNVEQGEDLYERRAKIARFAAMG